MYNTKLKKGVGGTKREKNRNKKNEIDHKQQSKMLIRTTSEPNQQAIPILIIAPIQNQQVMTESV